MPSGVGTTHHVKLGGHFYMVRPGSYLKKPAPQFGARFTTGDPDFNNLGMWQHWAQQCFIGGIDQDLWADDAMYDEGIGVDTTWHEKVTLSRNMARGAGTGWTLASGSIHGSQGNIAIVYNKKLYVYAKPEASQEGYLYRWDKSGDSWVRITALDAKNICGRSLAVYDGKLFIGGTDSVTNNPKVVYDDGALTSWSVLANPSGISGSSYGVNALYVFQQKLYVAFGPRVWRSKNNQTWDGNTEFYRANNTGGSAIVDMEAHLGFLYMLSSNGHVHRTDGNSTFDIWNWDGQTTGVAIKSFDGRLFILTYEFVETSSVGWGVLYQMSGSAMTQLKRFGDETNSNVIGNMVVYDRRLFYGATNGLGFADGTRPVFGAVAYDPIEDAHCIVAACSDATSYSRGTTPYENWIVDDIIFFGGRMFTFVRGHGAFYTPYQHRDRERGVRRYDISAAGASLADLNGGWLSTSTYDAGTPGVDKLWRKVTIDCETPTGTGIAIAYSTNNGSSWTALGTVSGAAARAKHEFFMDVSGTSLKLRFTLRSTDATVTPSLYGYNVSYLPTPEPNWMWSFTIVLSEKQVLLDGTEQTVDTEAELAFLSAAYRAHALLNFIDAEGDEWATGGATGVLVYDITFALRDLNQPLEGEVTITLLEAVETY